MGMNGSAVAVHRSLLVVVAVLASMLAGPVPARDDDDAAYREAVAAYESGDFESAARQFGTLAAEGHLSAQFNLANMYRTGEGVERDLERAAQWFRAAAEQGHPGAQNALGAMYAMGEGVEQSDVEAYAWFNVAAAQGNDMAQKNAARAERLISEDLRAMAKQTAAQYFRLYVQPNRESQP